MPYLRIPQFPHGVPRRQVFSGAFFRLALLLPAAILGVVLPGNLVAAQELRVPLVENVGVATETVPPSHVEFWLHRDVQRESLLEALNEADAFAGNLRRRLIEAEMNPVQLEAAAPTVTDLYSNRVQASVRIRYPASPHLNPESGLRSFAQLCETVLETAEHFDSDLVGPIMHVENKDPVIREAVSDAVANAFMAADAVASSMRATVYAVDTVQILEVTWNDSPESQAAEPTLRQAACTARVRVVYSLQDDSQP